MGYEIAFSRRSFGLCLVSFLLIPAAAAAREIAPLAEDASLNEEPFPVSLGDLGKIPEKYHRQEVVFEAEHPPGTVIIDTANRFLYLTIEDGRAIRYGIGVGREGFRWAGNAEVGHKAPWPRWVPPKAMVARDPFAAKWAAGMPGGPKNPLGARALYLYSKGVDTLYRIHGTHQPSSIGRAVSSGCIRMLNVDVIDLYNRVSLGTRVVVLPVRDRREEDPSPKKAPQLTAHSKPVSPLAVEPGLRHRRKVKPRPIHQKRNFNLGPVQTVKR